MTDMVYHLLHGSGPNVARALRSRWPMRDGSLRKTSERSARRRRTRREYVHVLPDGATVSRLSLRFVCWSDEQRLQFWGMLRSIMMVEVPQQARAFYLCVWCGLEPVAAGDLMAISRENATMARNRGEAWVEENIGTWVLVDG